MKLYFFKQPDETYAYAFREVVLHHNIRASKLFAATIGIIGLALTIIDKSTSSSQVFKYPGEYSAAIQFIFLSSCTCFLAFLIAEKLNTEIRTKVFNILTRIYPLVVIISSLWITFVMQHNPSNTMSVFVLGLLIVSSLWIFEGIQTILIALFILVSFNVGLHYFQTDPCKLFANYITGTCVSILFVCISRVGFSVNYNHFAQLKKIEEHNQTILRANEMQTEILSIVAHDLRAPINSIIGLTNILKDTESTAEEKNEYHDMIVDTCLQSKKIIDDLLNTAKNNGTNVDFEYTDMNGFIEDVVHKFIKKKTFIRQITFIKEPENIFAYINHIKIIRLFENLLDNAVKFTHDYGTITIKMSHDNNMITIWVSDNGIGIPKEMTTHLFKKFSQAGRSGMKGERSYGLGMSICKLIAEQHNGDITVYSEENKGTQIKITLPLADKF